jgi:hypothetical protein
VGTLCSPYIPHRDAKVSTADRMPIHVEHPRQKTAKNLQHGATNKNRHPNDAYGGHIAPKRVKQFSVTVR